jgi:hypothetical protein
MRIDQQIGRSPRMETRPIPLCTIVHTISEEAEYLVSEIADRGDHHEEKTPLRLLQMSQVHVQGLPMLSLSMTLHATRSRDV